MLSILILIGVVFLLISVGLSKYIKELANPFEENRKMFLFSIMLFLLFFIISLLIFHNRTDPYVRPLSYFVFFSLASVAVSCQILFVSNKMHHHYFILLEILVLSLSYIATQTSIYPTLLDIDPWLHRILTEDIIALGHIPEYLGSGDSGYKLMPGMHLNIATFNIVTGISYRLTTIITIGYSSLIILSISLYVAISRIFYSKLALMSVLLVVVSDSVLRMVAINQVPNTIGIALAILIFTLMIRDKKDFSVYFILILLTFCVAITHSIAYYVVIWQMLVIMIVSNIHKQKDFMNNLRLFVIILLVGLSYWFLIAFSYGRRVTLIIKRMLTLGGTDYYSGESTSVSFIDLFLGRMGIFIFMALMIIGLVWMFFNEKDSKRHVIFGISGTISGISVISFLTPSLIRIADRFWFYMQIIGGVVAMIGILLIVSPIKNRNIEKFLVVLFVFGFTFVMITSPTANNDNPIFTTHLAPRTGLTESELMGYEYIGEHIHNSTMMTTDRYYGERYRNYGPYYNLTYQRDRFEMRYANNDTGLMDSQHHIIIRAEIFNRGILWRRGNFGKVTNESYFIQQIDTSRNKIYDSYSIRIYSEPIVRN